MFRILAQSKENPTAVPLSLHSCGQQLRIIGETESTHHRIRNRTEIVNKLRITRQSAYNVCLYPAEFKEYASCLCAESIDVLSLIFGSDFLSLCPLR